MANEIQGLLVEIFMSINSLETLGLRMLLLGLKLTKYVTESSNKCISEIPNKASAVINSGMPQIHRIPNILTKRTKEQSTSYNDTFVSNSFTRWQHINRQQFVRTASLL